SWDKIPLAGEPMIDVVRYGNGVWVAAHRPSRPAGSGENPFEVAQVLRSVDNGQSWLPIDLPATLGGVGGLIHTENHFVLWWHNTVLASPDGAHWVRMTGTPPGRIVAIRPFEASGRIAAVLATGQIY